jgi:hypothetical protein
MVVRGMPEAIRELRKETGTLGSDAVLLQDVLHLSKRGRDTSMRVITQVWPRNV